MSESESISASPSNRIPIPIPIEDPQLNLFLNGHYATSSNTKEGSKPPISVHQKHADENISENTTDGPPTYILPAEPISIHFADPTTTPILSQQQRTATRYAVSPMMQNTGGRAKKGHSNRDKEEQDALSPTKYIGMSPRFMFDEDYDGAKVTLVDDEEVVEGDFSGWGSVSWFEYERNQNAGPFGVPMGKNCRAPPFGVLKAGPSGILDETTGAFLTAGSKNEFGSTGLGTPSATRTAKMGQPQLEHLTASAVKLRERLQNGRLDENNIVVEDDDMETHGRNQHHQQQMKSPFKFSKKASDSTLNPFTAFTTPRRPKLTKTDLEISIFDASSVEEPKIGEWMATAIGGHISNNLLPLILNADFALLFFPTAANDLVGSLLYTIGVVTTVAGKFAPISLLLVCLSLFPFKRVISEVVDRIPLNGGIYSAMILTSSKEAAAFAACCSILDYVATAVVSAASASAYVKSEVPIISSIGLTLGVLGFFGILTMFGVKESSAVSFGILAMHIITVTLVAIFSVVKLTQIGPEVLLGNIHQPTVSDSWAYDIFIGYCVGMLGVTGFETSANYGSLNDSKYFMGLGIEQQKPGVFPKTLRNMCYMVLLCNPLMSVLALAVLPITTITSNSSIVLSVLADAVSGRWLQLLLAVDAVVVLSGGVLTAFVGVGGLLEHMTNDNMIPPFLLWKPYWPTRKSVAEVPSKTSNSSTSDTLNEEDIGTPGCTNKTKATSNAINISPPLIPLSFLCLCSLLYLSFKGDVSILSLAFSMAFLSVLGTFVVCNIILRVRMEREVKGGFKATASADERAMKGSGGLSVILCSMIVLIAVVGNAIYAPNMISTFFMFFATLLFLLTLILYRVQIARVVATLVLGVDDSARHRDGVPNGGSEGAELNSASVGVVGRGQGHEVANNVTVRKTLFDRVSTPLKKWIHSMRERPVAYFSKDENLHHLNYVIQYVLGNEATSRLLIVHCYEELADIPPLLEEHCRVLDHVYPSLRLDLVMVKCKFDAGVIQQIAKSLGVQQNMCLVSRPWQNTTYLAELKGVRVILLRR
ncbi:hypothetical protein HDU76_010391 [Blyttiomyces sp. JEL0837]|nr:hypothetical protein HDU76_010391 [Blyttiomyces sp. JEL0837]